MHPFDQDEYSWNASKGGDFLWSSTNFGEAITEVMTPLTWSVIQYTLDDWVYVPGYPSVGNIGGYPYLNISVFMTALQAIGKKRQDLLDMMEGALYMNLPDGMEVPGVPVSRSASLSTLPNLLRVQIKLRLGERRFLAYLAANSEWFSRTFARIQNERSASGLLALWQDEIHPHIKRGVWTVLGVSMSSSEYTASLQKRIQALAGAEVANKLIANIDSTNRMLPSLGLVFGLNQVANGQWSREAYLQQYGHRGPHEFELSKPRPVEDPTWMDAQIDAFQASPIDIQALRLKKQEAFDQAWQAFRTRHPQVAKSFHLRLKESARRAMRREQARSEYVRDRWIIRLFALRASVLTGLGGDVFFLTLKELLKMLAGNTEAARQIPGRQELYQRYKDLPTFPSVIRGYFDPLAWAGGSEPRSDIYEERPAAKKDPASANILKGGAGSAGLVEGRVRVIARPELGELLQVGEILVAVQTDIAWTLLFPRAAAVITDVGAPLSHAAIVARELGIPAVVGCGDATTRLKTGDYVRVDGARGEIVILEHGDQK